MDWIKKATGWRAIVIFVIMLIVPLLLLQATGRSIEDINAVKAFFQTVTIPVFLIAFIAMLIGYYRERRKSGTGVVASLVGVMSDLIARVLEEEKGGKPVIAAAPSIQPLTAERYRQESWMSQHIGTLWKVPEVKPDGARLFAFGVGLPIAIFTVVGNITILIVGSKSFSFPTDLDGATLFAILFLVTQALALTAWVMRERRRMAAWLITVTQERDRLARELAAIGGIKDVDITFIDRKE
jgi:signal transduction histidine kinase